MQIKSVYVMLVRKTKELYENLLWKKEVYFRFIIGFISTFIMMVLLSCSYVDDNNSLNNISLNKCEKLDSFILNSAQTDYVFLGIRKYPLSCNEKDSILINGILNDSIYSVIEKGDSLFIFSSARIFDYDSNQFLPNLFDSNLYSSYSNYYKITIDDEGPYFIYFKSNLDNIALRKYENNYFWDEALITDTIIKLGDNIKVGMKKSLYFNSIGLNKFNYEKKHFTVILMSAFNPSYIWYKNYISNDFIQDSGWFLFIFNFFNDKINSIKITYEENYNLCPSYIRSRFSSATQSRSNF